MTKNQNLFLFVVALVALIAVLWWVTGSIKPTTGPELIWFNGGLFTLVVARFIVEYRFPRPNDVFLNSLAVFISISSLAQPPHAAWWEALRWSAFAIGCASLFLSWDARHSPDEQPSAARRAAYALVTGVGKSTVIFSVVFVLALLSYFDLDSPQSKVVVITWGAILILANLRLDGIVGRIWTKKPSEVLGFVSTFLAPRTVFFERADGVTLENKKVIGIRSRGSGEIFPAIVVGERRAPGEIRYVANLLSSTLRDSEIDRNSQIVATEFESENGNAAELRAAEHVIGLVGEGTTVATLKFEVLGKPDISTGSLLEAISEEKRIYYQLFDGLVQEEPSLSKSERSFVTAHAEQIGIWDVSRNGFETHGWVAPENTTIGLVDPEAIPDSTELEVEHTEIGQIPKSQFPAVVSLKDMILYHSAVLGVTGSGKSFLTFELLEKCSDLGTKVICIDPTGDYQRYLSNAVLIRSHKGLRRLLDSDEKVIGILETAINSKDPIIQCHDAAQICLDWCKEHRKEDEIIRPEPKILFVMEEAHLLIPEWNFNPNKGLQDKVNLTSQIVLQARKYGLGFLIVAQRTANVSKSALNQCNTIIALQQFDQTGAEFLANYMGKHHVSSLPNLPERHGIIVGKASASQRPVLVRFNEQDRKLNEEKIPDMPDEGERGSMEMPRASNPLAESA